MSGAYSACSDELRKLAVRFNLPKLKLFKTRLQEHTVRMAPVGVPVMAAPKGGKVSRGPDIEFGHAGDVGRAIQPPAVRA
jgi:hypothetical protein